MKTFATASKRSHPRRGPARLPLRSGPFAQRAEIRQILHGSRLQTESAVPTWDDAFEREAEQGEAVGLTQTREPRLQRFSPSSSSSSGSSGGAGGGEIPRPTPKDDGTCDCRLDICWRPIQLWYVPSHFKHGFINVIDSACNTHNLYVDPGQHGGHSHAVDSTPGWDTSGETCLSFSPYPCSIVDKLAPATTRYEGLDVAYDATSGPNSNSFLEWILDDAGLSLSAPHPGLMAWDYYKSNPAHRSSPPRHTRTAPAPGAAPAPAGGTP